MGTHGSLLHPRIAETLQPLLQIANGEISNWNDLINRNTHVVCKGFHPEIDSFGGFPYDQSNEKWKERLPHVSDTAVEWAGAWALRASSISANAPADVLSLLDNKSCVDLLPKGKGGSIFCFGMAVDY